MPIGPPRLHVDAESVDLGEVPVRDDPHVAQFVVSNSGWDLLRVYQVGLSCTCLNAEISQRTLKPLESAQLKVAVRSQQSESRQTTVIVHSNDPMQPRRALSVKWRAVAPIEFDPLRIHFGTVRPGQSVERRVSVIRRDAGEPHCQVSELRSSKPGTLVVSRPNQTSEINRFTVCLQPGSHRGEYTGFIRGTIAGCDVSEMSLPVNWTVRDVIEVSPTELFLGFLAPGSLIRKKMIVTCDRNLSLDVVEANLHGEGINGELATEQLSPATVVVDIVARAPETPGERQDKIEITCAHPVERTLTVPVSMIVQDSADR